MIRKKSSFLTFCFSFIPGAGQMYMGFMKRGISLMSSFLLICFLSAWLRMSPLLLILPIIWFFAFFDTFNLRAMPDDEFYAMEDDFLFPQGFNLQKTRDLVNKFRIFFAGGLIIIGFTVLWNNMCDMFSRFIPYQIMNVFNSFGEYFLQLIFAAAIIALGIYLIIGKKKELDSMDQAHMLEDKGGPKE